MSWSISASGDKRSVKMTLAAQTNVNVTNGFMTEAQATMAQALVDAAPGKMVSISGGGHNNADSGGFSVTVSSSA